MSIKVACLILLLSLSGMVSAANNVQVIEDVLTGDKQQSTVDKPEPAALQANWWDYFSVSGEALQSRIDETVERLQQLPDSLPPELLAQAQPLIERINNNLQSLPQLRAQETQEPPPPPVFAERYTLQALLALVEQWRRTQTALAEQQADLKAMESAFNTLSRRVDTLLAAYLGLSPDAPERMLRGLEVMAERTSVALAEERLRLQRGATAATATKVTQLQQERTVARGRLEVEQADVQRLQQAIEQAREQMEQTREQAFAAQTRAMDVVTANSPEEVDATMRYRQQRAIAAGIAEALATVEWIRLQLEHSAALLLLGENEPDIRGLRQQQSDWHDQLAVIRSQAVAWTRDAERERARAGEAVARAEQRADTEPPMFSDLINADRVRLAQANLTELDDLRDRLAQAELLDELLDTAIARNTGWVNNTLILLEEFFRHGWEQALDWTRQSLFKLGGTPVTALGLARVVLILLLAWLVSYWLRHGLKRFGQSRGGINESAIFTVGRLSHYTIMIIGLMIGLSSIGIGFSNFALIAGAAAFGIGFGLQSIVNNFVSGLILLFERSLKVGDFVELSTGVMGEVRAINVRSTLINTNDNIDIVVPNSEFINARVINWTLSEGFCRIHIPFSVAFDSDKDLVRRAVLQAAEHVPHTLTGIPGKAPGVWLIRYGESRMEFELVVWVTPKAVKRPSAVHAAYMWEIDSALRAHGIKVPFPQRDLHLRSGFERLVSARRMELEKE